VADRTPSPLARFAPPAAAFLLFLFALQLSTQNLFHDFFIYRAGAEIGLRGESPYRPEVIQERVLAQFPDLDESGFFLPPLAIVLFAPYTLLPLPAAKVAWAVTCGLAGLALAYLPRRFGAPKELSPVWAVAPFVLLLNNFTVVVLTVGQTTLVAAGCVAAGQWCFERGRRWVWVGCVLWAVPFVKPHLALPLIPLAWYLGGWRRAAGVLAAVGALTLAGCQIAGGSPLFLRDYLAFVSEGHKVVSFNRVEINPQIGSWNRLLFAAGGPLVELTAVSTVGGYLVWFGLAVARCAAAGVKPSASWAVAVCATGAVLCSQVLPYELLVLVLVVPYLRDSFAAGYRVLPAVTLLLLLAQLLPPGLLEGIGMGAHRPLRVVALAVAVLLAPPAPHGADSIGRRE
jgi:hypothetical protein